MPFKLPAYSDLNETQKLVLRLFPRMDKLAIVGGPGTGKTIVAALGAIQMAGTNEKPCLFLSYSKTLKAFLEYVISNSPEMKGKKIIVDTFHHWIWYFLQEKFGLSPDVIKDIYEESEYVYDVKKLTNLLDSSGKKPEELICYNCLFVDEAQDLQDGVTKVLKRFAKKVFVTYDDSQKVGYEDKTIGELEFDHSNILNDLGIGDSFFDLIENYRNTKEIESLAKGFLSSYDENEMSLLKTSSRRVGPRPKLVKGMTTYKQVADYILARYDKSKSVAVLIGNEDVDIGKKLFDSLEPYFKDGLAEIRANFFYKYGRHNNINGENAASKGLFLMPMKSSKGLEFDQVYVIAKNIDISKTTGRNTLFVALTRASEAVTIIASGKEESRSINEALREMPEMFDIEEVK